MSTLSFCGKVDDPGLDFEMPDVDDDAELAKPVDQWIEDEGLPSATPIPGVDIEEPAAPDENGNAPAHEA